MRRPTAKLDYIKLDLIQISRDNVRATYKEAKLGELVDSIREYGVLQPVVVIDRDGKYELVVGQRRLLACRKLRLKKIPALILPRVDRATARVLSLTENIQRVELNRGDIVDAIDYLYTRYGKSARRVARALGVSLPTVYSYLKIGQAAPETVKVMMRERRITKTDVMRVIEAGGGDEEKMVELAKRITTLTVPEKERVVPAGRENPEASADELIEVARSPHVVERVVVALTPAEDSALRRAAKERGVRREEAAKVALLDWLRDRGYYPEAVKGGADAKRGH